MTAPQISCIRFTPERFQSAERNSTALTKQSGDYVSARARETRNSAKPKKGRLGPGRIQRDAKRPDANAQKT